MDCCYVFGNKHIFLVHVLLQRVYDEEVEETITKVDALEKQSEQVYRINSTTSTTYWCKKLTLTNGVFQCYFYSKDSHNFCMYVYVCPLWLAHLFFLKEKTREQKEAELIPKMQEAVNYGLRVLESAFEHLDIKAGNSDSEDEDITDRVEAILEPKVCSWAWVWELLHKYMW